MAELYRACSGRLAIFGHRSHLEIFRPAVSYAGQTNPATPRCQRDSESRRLREISGGLILGADNHSAGLIKFRH
jgi:hypothetical protein